MDRKVTRMGPMKPMVVASAKPTSRMPSTNSSDEHTRHRPRATCNLGLRTRNDAPRIWVVSRSAIPTNTMYRVQAICTIATSTASFFAMVSAAQKMTPAVRLSAIPRSGLSIWPLKRFPSPR
jgi:hypothetical protein